MFNRILFAAGAAEGAHFTSIAGAGTSGDTGHDVAVHTDGSYYVVGNYSDTNTCGYVVKLDSSGNEVWKRKLSVGGATVAAVRCGLDSSGNLYVGAYRAGASGYASLVKYNSSGTLQWQRKLTWASSCQLLGLDVDSSGNCVLGIDVNAATVYGIVAVYNSSGTLQWQRKTSHTWTCGASAGAAFDPSSGDIYTLGAYNNGGSGSSLAEWIAQKYNSSGTRQWQKSFKINESRGYRVAVDSAGNVFYSGHVTISGSSRHAVMKVNSSGTEQWHQYLTTSANPGSAFAFHTDSSDNIWVSGNQGTIVKLDGATGAISLQRLFAGDSGTPGAGGVRVAGSSLYVALAAAKTGAGNDAVVLRGPVDGSGIGTYDWIDYTAGSLAVSTSTFTAATPATTDAAGDGTDAAGTLTDAAGNVTVTRIS